MIEIIFLLLGLFYFLLCSSFFIGILFAKKKKTSLNNWKPKVSVLVPARNEAATITETLQGLHNQTYPAEKLEIIIIDDNSSDHTSAVVSTFIEENNLENIRLLNYRTVGNTYKKAAIAHALEFSSGEIIMTTDADCIVKPQWVESMIAQYEEETGMIAGLITFDPKSEKTIFSRLQTLEFAGIVFAGVGAVGIGYPLICNGSNLSYRRRAYDDVDGFSGHDHLPSGDDDLLMQNIHKKTSWKIKYNINSASINSTHPLNNLNRFLNQRSRWASKGIHYPGTTISIMLFLVYAFYAAILVLTPLTIMGLFPSQFLLLGFLLKWIPEFLIINEALRILQRDDLLSLFLTAQLFHIPYLVIVGFRGFFNLFKWKNG